jgi:hypothetical protein
LDRKPSAECKVADDIYTFQGNQHTVPIRFQSDGVLSRFDVRLDVIQFKCSVFVEIPCRTYPDVVDEHLKYAGQFRRGHEPAFRYFIHHKWVLGLHVIHAVFFVLRKHPRLPFLKCVARFYAKPFLNVRVVPQRIANRAVRFPVDGNAAELYVQGIGIGQFYDPV